MGSLQLVATVAATFVLAPIGVLTLPAVGVVIRGHALRADADDFATATCQPSRTEAERRLPCLHACYRPVFNCSYMVDGVGYLTDSTFLDLPYELDSAAEARALVMSSPTVFYDRADPRRAVLARTVSYDRAWPEAAIAVGSFGALIAAWTHLARARRRRRTDATIPSARTR